MGKKEKPMNELAELLESLATDAGGPGEFKYDGGPKPYISKETGEVTPKSKERVEGLQQQEPVRLPEISIPLLSPEQQQKVDTLSAKYSVVLNGLQVPSKPSSLKESFNKALDFMGLLPSKKASVSSRRKFLTQSMAVVASTTAGGVLGKGGLKALSEMSGLSAETLAAPSAALVEKSFSTIAVKLVNSYLDKFKESFGEGSIDELREIRVDEAAESVNAKDLMYSVKQVAEDMEESLRISVTEDSAIYPTFLREFKDSAESLKDILKLAGVDEQSISRFVANPQELSNLAARYRSSFVSPENAPSWKPKGFQPPPEQMDILTELEAELPPPEGFFAEGEAWESSEEFEAHKVRQAEFQEEWNKKYPPSEEAEAAEPETAEAKVETAEQAEAAETSELSELTAEGGSESSIASATTRLAATFNRIDKFLAEENKEVSHGSRNLGIDSDIALDYTFIPEEHPRQKDPDWGGKTQELGNLPAPKGWQEGGKSGGLAATVYNARTQEEAERLGQMYPEFDKLVQHYVEVQDQLTKSYVAEGKGVVNPDFGYPESTKFKEEFVDPIEKRIAEEEKKIHSELQLLVGKWGSEQKVRFYATPEGKAQKEEEERQIEYWNKENEIRWAKEKTEKAERKAKLSKLSKTGKAKFQDKEVDDYYKEYGLNSKQNEALKEDEGKFKRTRMLSEHELQTIDEYGASADFIQGYLAFKSLSGRGRPGGQAAQFGGDEKYAQTIVKEMSKACNSFEVNHDLDVYRGIRTFNDENGKLNAQSKAYYDAFLNAEPGDTIHNPAFSSTTTDMGRAVDFSEMHLDIQHAEKETQENTEGMILHIGLKKGQKALEMNRAGHFGMLDGLETREVVLDKDSRFKVESVDKEKRIVKLSLLDKGTATDSVISLVFN
jgi:hypothetical protein